MIGFGSIGKVNFFLWCISCFVLSTLGQIPDGNPCYTPRDEYGLCINIKQCKVLLDLLLNQRSNPGVVDYLRSSTCGYDGRTPRVCCPQTIQKNKPAPVDPGRGEESKAEGRGLDIKLLSPPNCGFSNKSNSKIVGGVPAALGEFPWLVALGYRNNDNPNIPKWLCGGTMITDRHVLTAAHCIHNRTDLYIARVGEYELYEDNDGAFPENIPLKKTVIHEDFNPVQYTNDIGILTLERAPNNNQVWPVCLPHSEPYRSRTFVKYNPLVAGWGSLYFNGPSSSVLQVTSILVFDNEKCKKAYENKSIIDDRVICAGWTTGGKDACKGDSGGPLMYGKVEPNNLRYYQIGVVSYGIRCADAGYPGVYTRVTNFIDWIQRNLD